MDVDLTALELELKRRVSEYPATPWGRQQADDWDRLTNFIYLAPKWDNVLRITDDMRPELRNYAINRWFNYWSAVGVETIFCNLPGVTAAKNPKDRLVDFTIRGVKFDHKTSVFPQGYGKTYAEARYRQVDLIHWLYQNQSQQKRHHYANRLFVILVDLRHDQHWQLRAELSLIKEAVESFLAGFDRQGLLPLQLDGHEFLSDIVWVVRR